MFWIAAVAVSLPVLAPSPPSPAGVIASGPMHSELGPIGPGGVCLQEFGRFLQPSYGYLVSVDRRGDGGMTAALWWGNKDTDFAKYSVAGTCQWATAGSSIERPLTLMNPLFLDAARGLDRTRSVGAALKAAFDAAPRWWTHPKRWYFEYQVLDSTSNLPSVINGERAVEYLIRIDTRNIAEHMSVDVRADGKVLWIALGS